MFVDYCSNTLNLVNTTIRYCEIENVQFLTFDTFDHHPKAPKSVVTKHYQTLHKINNMFIYDNDIVNTTKVKHVTNTYLKIFEFDTFGSLRKVQH